MSRGKGNISHSFLMRNNNTPACYFSSGATTTTTTTATPDLDKISTTPTTNQISTTTTTTPTKTLHEETQNIISTPIGEFTSETMDQIITILEQWLIINNSQESLDQVIQLFHRIIDENENGNPRAHFHHTILQKVLMKCITTVNTDTDTDIDIDTAITAATNENGNDDNNNNNNTNNDVVAQIKDIVKRLDGIYDKSTMPYNVIISVLSKCHQLDAVQYSTQLLQQVLDQNNKDYMDGKMIQVPFGVMDDKGSDGSDGSGANRNGSGGGYGNGKKMNLTVADTVTFNSVISAWMNISSNESIAGIEAMRILNRMKGSYRLGNIHVKPSMLSFSMTITAILTSSNIHAQMGGVALHAEEVLQDMIYFYNDDEDIHKKLGYYEKEVKPDKGIFDNVMNALVKLNQQEENNQRRELYLKKARNLLQQMEELGENPDTLTYNSLIAIILRTKSKEEAVRCIEDVISTMKDKYSSANNFKAKVNTITYNSLIKAHAMNYDGRRAESVLRRMILSANTNLDVQPDTITFNTVIEAHARSKSRRSVDDATRILHEMSSYDHVNPDKITMSLMLIALTRSANRGDKNAGKQAMLMLDRMEKNYEAGHKLMKPDTFTYSQIISCIAKSGGRDSHSMARDVLRRMDDLQSKGREDLKPDTVTLNAMLLAIANSESNRAAAQAEEFLNSMARSKDPAIAPNTTSYSTVIAAWAKSNDKNRVERAEKLLERMENGDSNTAPNTVAYSSVLQVLAKSNSSTAVERSMNILQQMEDSYANDKNVKPNAYTYASVMETIGNTSNRQMIATKAQELLTRMINMATRIEEHNNVSFTIVFNNAIRAIEKSGERKKAMKAESILKLMKTLNDSEKLKAPPSVRTYNAVIRCCAFNPGNENEKRAAFDVALDAFTEMRSDPSLGPDNYTYPTIFKACERLLGTGEKDYETVKILFYFCCEDGLVNPLILNNLRNYLPPKVLLSVVGSMDFDTLPQDWGRNTQQKKKQHRR